MFSIMSHLQRPCSRHWYKNGQKKQSIMFYYMYITYTTTYLQAISNCGVMVSQGLTGEGVGRVHIVEIPKIGYVLGVVEKFPHQMTKNANI
jgi:hypothetical protein